jgi:xanthine dehydrogenase accessory factor
MLIVGDGPVSEALEAMASALGWAPVVTAELDGALGALPGCESVVVLSHHEGVDGPALAAAVASGAAYVGAMGSRKTQARRRAWMLANGVALEQLDSVRGPAGLDIGADTPGEIAISILAEVIACLRGVAGGGGRSLSELDGPIHPGNAPGTAYCPAG